MNFTQEHRYHCTQRRVYLNVWNQPGEDMEGLLGCIDSVLSVSLFGASARHQCAASQPSKEDGTMRINFCNYQGIDAATQLYNS